MKKIIWFFWFIIGAPTSLLIAILGCLCEIALDSIDSLDSLIRRWANVK